MVTSGPLWCTNGDGVYPLQLERTRMSNVVRKADSPAVTILNFKEAIDRMEKAETATYRQAMLRCPDVLQVESNPLWFVIHSEHDYQQAARRMVEYWKIRLETFGDRAFEPVLDLSSENGALSATAKEIVYKGASYVLPSDTSGRVVAFLLGNKLKPRILKKMNAAAEHQREARFYLMQSIVTIDNARQFGIVLAQLITEQKPRVSPEEQAWYHRILRDCLPIRWKRSLVVCVPPSPARLTTYHEFKDFLEQVMIRTAEVAESRRITVLDPSSDVISRHRIATALIQEGIPQEYLPPQAGGNWTSHQSMEWFMQLRQQQLGRRKVARREESSSLLAMLAAVATAQIE